MRSRYWRKTLTFSGQGSKKWCRRAQQPQLRNRNAHSCSLGSASMSAFVSTNRKLAGYWKAVSISLGNAGLECLELVISVGLPVPCSTCRSHRPQQTADHSVWYIFTRLTGSNFYQQRGTMIASLIASDKRCIFPVQYVSLFDMLLLF